MTEAAPQYLRSVTLDEKTIAPRSDALEHERSVAIQDLTDWNHFAVEGLEGPYALTLKSEENRVTFTAVSDAGKRKIPLPLAPFRSVIRDYSLICESYLEAVTQGNLSKIEAIDMSRRGLHNEGADLLIDLLKDAVTLDYETARRLFTLLRILHLK